MTSLHNITNRALEQWIHVTGVNPDGKQNRWNWGSYDISRINEYIVAAQDLDATGLTAYMVVRAVVHDYIKDQSFDALSLVEETPEVMQRIAALRILHKLVQDPEALAVVRKFQDRLRKAADFYGLRDKVEATIEDMSELSHIRRDALICATLLEKHTFAKGDQAKVPLQYNRNVIKLWNMNSLVRMAQAQPTNGISIVLVRDPQYVAYSFFCFLVRDGGNITIWTDRDKQPHPMAKSMSRSRATARQLHSRADRLRFPYQLLDAKFIDEGKYVHETIGTELVRTNVEAVAISPLENLEPDQLLWALLALDVLVKEEPAAKLSVIGEDMTLRLAPGQHRVLPETLEPTKQLGHEDVTAKTSNKEGYRSLGVHVWMEKRYKDLVDPRLYNLTDVPREPEAKPIFGVPEEVKPRDMVVLGGEHLDVAELLPTRGKLRSNGAYPGKVSLHKPEIIGLDPVAFGAPKEMEGDRLWIARWNQAQALAMLAQEEFELRFPEVRTWFETRIKANADVIIDRMAQGTWKIGVANPIAQFASEPVREYNLIKWHRQTNGKYPACAYDKWPSKDDAQGLLYQADQKIWEPSCYITRTTASYWACLLPQSPEGIAALAGVPMSGLPPLLEHWYSHAPYVGNSILCRTDPLDSEIGNPWAALTFQVIVGLSKREWNRRVKACATPGNISWAIKRHSGTTTYWSDRE